MNVTSNLVKAFALLVLLLVLAFGLQHGFSQEPSRRSEFALEAYLFNFALTSLLVVSIAVWHKALKDRFGYFYLGFISVKFITFFILIYPGMKGEDAVPGSGLIFLVPFLLCLLCEVLLLVQLMNQKS